MSESSSDSGFAYRAFVSYSHRDKAWGDWLHKALETYRVPGRLVGKQTEAGTIPRRLHPIFRDREELASATDLGRVVNEALAQSHSMVVICSPASAASRWVNEEVLAFKRMGRAERIFCLIVAGEPNATDTPGQEAEECFCPALRFKLDASGRLTGEPTEPIAADARGGKDGKTNARLKLIAGMLGVGFDALKQREQRRKMRRMTAVTASSLVVMAAMIVLTVFAFISRHDAVTARHQAVAAQQTAERRQKQAEGLVDFMLGDLSYKIGQLGRLDILQSVDDKAMAYFKSLPPTDVNDTALAQRAEALEKIGGVRMQAGNDPGALEAFRASTRISSRLAAAAPHNAQRQVAYSRTLAFIGTVYEYQDKFRAAQEILEKAQRVLQPSVKRSPNDHSVLIQLVYVENDLASALRQRGRPQAAEAEFRDMLKQTRELHAAKPGNGNYVQALGVALDNLGILALQRGDLATAVADFHAESATEVHASVRNPKDNIQRGFALEAQERFGNTLGLSGNVRGGMQELQQAVGTAAKLIQSEPRNSVNKRDFAQGSSKLARLKRLSGDLATAETLNAKAVTVIASVIKANPTNSRSQEVYAGALIEQAVEQRAAGKRDAAAKSVRSALDALKPLMAKEPGDPLAQQPAMRARLLLASLEPDATRAAVLREQALKALRAAPTPKKDPRSAALEVQVLLALNRNSEAQPLISRLRNEGYRDPAFTDLLKRAHIAYPVNPAFKAKLLAAEKRTANPPTTAGADPGK